MLVLLFALAVLLFPTNRPSYYWQPFQSEYFFGGHILDFSVVYVTFVFLVLLASRRICNDSAGLQKGAILVAIFTLVSICFWTIKISQPALASFDSGGESYSKYLMEQGRMVSTNGNFGYFEFPAISMIGAFLSYLTGLDVPTAAKLFLIFGVTILSVSIYLFVAKALKKYNRAVILGLLAVMGNVTMFSFGYFRPDTLGILFFIPLFSLLSLKDGLLITPKGQVVIVISFFGLVLTGFIYTVGFFLMFASLYVVSRLIKSHAYIRPNTLLLMLIAAAGIRFFLYFGYEFIPPSFIVSRLQQLLSSPNSLFSFSAVSSYQTAFVGSSNPFWVTLTRSFWLAFAIMGVLIGVLTLLPSRIIKKSPTHYQLKESSCLIGVLVLMSLMIPLDNGANRSATAFLILTSFFGIIIAARLSINLLSKVFEKIPERGIARLSITILAFVIIATLSLSSFLALNPTPNTDYTYPQEAQALALVTAVYANNQVFVDVNTALLVSYYIPNIFPNYVNFFPDPLGEFTPISVNNYFNNIVPTFARSFASNHSNIFFYSPRITQNALSTWGISPQNSSWSVLTNVLMHTDIVYENGFNVVYYYP